MRRLLGNLALTFGSVLLALALGEIAARLVLPPQPIYRVPQARHDPHPVLGWVLRPSQDAFTHDAPVHVNAAGLRDDEELPATKPDTEPRVLVLGDSLTFGNGVRTEETYPMRLEQQLRARDPGVRVLNSGVQGWDTNQEADSLRERGFAFAPDVVVVGFFANDVRVRLAKPSAFVQVDEGGRMVLPGVRGLVSDEVVYLAKRLRIVSAILYGAQELRYRLWPPKSDFWVGAIYRNEETPLSRRAWDDVRTALTRLRDDCRERGIEIVLLLLPLRTQVSATPFTAGYQDRAIRVAGELGIRVVDALPAFIAAGSGADLFIPFDGHPNAHGQRVTAEALVAPVEEALARARARRAAAAIPRSAETR